MPSLAPIECDLIDVVSAEKLRTLHLSVIPRVGEELQIDLGDRDPSSGTYRVERVLYHLRPRMLVRTDDLFGVSIFIERF
jgi:hypothetical protein